MQIICGNADYLHWWTALQLTTINSDCFGYYFVICNYCATQICIARTFYGDVAGWLAGWLAVRHTPVLYQNG